MKKVNDFQTDFLPECQPLMAGPAHGRCREFDRREV
jgi:hypothetical protein